jgi:hypothetical protein
LSNSLVSLLENQPVDVMKQLESQATLATTVAAPSAGVIQKGPQKAVSFVRSEETLPAPGAAKNFLSTANPEEIQLDDDGDSADEEEDAEQSMTSFLEKIQVEIFLFSSFFRNCY